MSEDNDLGRFSELWWRFLRRKSAWEDGLTDLLSDGEDFDRLGTDDYDASLEIYGATNDWRLSAEVQAYIASAGFFKVYVNHADGWQTHYTFGREAVTPVRGWRRRYVEDATATTTNVIAGPKNNGYFEISYWPEGWDSPGCKDWLSSGYMRIVPDPLDTFAPSPSAGS